MASVIDIHSKFIDALNENRSLFIYCRSPVGPHSNAGVESAFLEAFKGWEVFLEDLTIAYLTGERDIAGYPAPTVVSVSDNDAEICRSIINGGRAYVGWANPDEVKKRLSLFFVPETLDMKLNSGIAEIREMVDCRNAIAHSSGRARIRLNNLWTAKRGTSKSSVQRSADVLLAGYSTNPPMTWFDRYLEVLEVMSQNLVQI